MEFEWDQKKNHANMQKHGIDFQDAKNVFLDPRYITEMDCRNDYREARYRIIGMVEEQILLVVYTYRNGRIRMISARRARKDERRTYCESHT
ncbi:MAG: BrnT family toxin [Chloroflexota bacterium]